MKHVVLTLALVGVCSVIVVPPPTVTTEERTYELSFSAAVTWKVCLGNFR